VGWIGRREYASRRPVFRNAELYEQLERVGGGPTTTRRVGDHAALPVGPGSTGGFDLPRDLRVDQGFLRARQHSAGVALALAVVALAGLVVGAVVAGRATGGVLETFGIDGTVFGVTIATLALSLEDVFLTVEPARRGAPEIGIANVIGSVLFSVTGKLGIVLLAGGAIVVDDDVLTWHLPVLLTMTVLAAVFLATGRLRRWHGVVLLGLYVAYFVVSLVAFGGVPLDTD
jgi:cation:H+ antiporter